jgi:hypothetical protein
MSPRRRVARGRRGGLEIRLPAEERQLLGSLPGQLERLLDEAKEPGPPIDGLRRLFPVAYARDPSAEAAYAELVRGDLLDHHLEALAVLAQTADASHLSDEEAEAWLAAVNDLRLVLGTTLGVDEEPRELDDADPHYADWICYSYLSYLQGEIVDALSGALPPPVAGADDEVPDDPWGDLPGDLRWDGTVRPNRG